MSKDSVIRLLLATLDGAAYDAAIQIADESQIIRSVSDRRRLRPDDPGFVYAVCDVVRHKYHRYNFECRDGIFYYCDGVHPKHEVCRMEPMTIEMLQDLVQQ